MVSEDLKKDFSAYRTINTINMKIILVQLGTIGDMILLTPIFKMLKYNLPQAELYAIASRHNYQIIKNNPHIKKFFVYKKSFPEIFNFFLELRKYNFDYLIDPKDHFSRESRILARVIKAKTKIGYNASTKKIYDISIPGSEENANLHFTQRAINTLKYLDIEIPNEIPQPDLYLDNQSEIYTFEFLSSIGFEKNKKILINISASQEKKMWEIEKWLDVINWLSEKNLPLILINAPSEKKQAEQILERCKRIYHFESRSINDAISIISKVNLLITPDTSLVHIASAFDVPVFGLYSGLDDFFAKFYPLTTHYKVVRARKGFDGIKDISSEKAISELEIFLKQLNFEE